MPLEGDRGIGSHGAIARLESTLSFCPGPQRLPGACVIVRHLRALKRENSIGADMAVLILKASGRVPELCHKRTCPDAHFNHNVTHLGSETQDASVIWKDPDGGRWRPGDVRSRTYRYKLFVAAAEGAARHGNPMQQIADWLKKLGMAQYAQAFSDNDIDFSVLRHLTDQHLKDLGVSLGHRLKMLQAIRDLDEASTAVTAPSAPSATEPARQDDAERRQLTVVFCDLVGSTALSTRLDPEDLRTVIRGYHKCVARIVSRFDGFVAKYMGDGVLVYFGYPKAHEDDAERAVRAALALTEAVGNLSGVDPLQVRIGAATGVVVVGDLVGSGEAQERAVVGETPNLAARLQAIAAPNMASSPTPPEGLSAICSSFRTSEPKTSRVSPGRCAHGRRFGRAILRAASKHCTLPG